MDLWSESGVDRSHTDSKSEPFSLDRKAPEVVCDDRAIPQLARAGGWKRTEVEDREQYPDEYRFLRWLVDVLPADEACLLSNDIECASVLDASQGSVWFAINGYERPPYLGQNPYSIEASIRDATGNSILVIAFTDQNKRLLCLDWLPEGDADLATKDLSCIEIVEYIDRSHIPRSATGKRRWPASALALIFAAAAVVLYFAANR